MLVIPVNRVVDKKRIIGKNWGVTDPEKWDNKIDT
jgi:hypothetical protein